MSIVGEPPRAGNLVGRAINIITKPGATWDLIALEPATIPGLFTGYAMILAAIGPICSAIGMIVFGVGVPGVMVLRVSPVGAIVSAIVSYILALALVFVLGLIIEALAPSFDGTKDRVQAMKVAVYSQTPAWLAGVFGLIPMLGILAILGLYGLVLLYMGLPRVMRSPPAKSMGYTAVIVVIWIVLAIVIGLVLAPLHMIGAAAGGMTTTTTSITHY